jgi:hypothetical protein
MGVGRRSLLVNFYFLSLLAIIKNTLNTFILNTQLAYPQKTAVSNYQYCIFIMQKPPALQMALLIYWSH